LPADNKLLQGVYYHEKSFEQFSLAFARQPDDCFHLVGLRAARSVYVVSGDHSGYFRLSRFVLHVSAFSLYESGLFSRLSALHRFNGRREIHVRRKPSVRIFQGSFRLDAQ
jgi:hypothetical protein